MSSAPLAPPQDATPRAASYLPEDDPGIVVRSVRWIDSALRPDRGWLAFLFSLAVALLPAYMLRANQWIRLSSSVQLLLIAAAAGVIAVWLFAGWRHLVLPRRWRWLQMIMVAAAVLATGFVVVSLIAIQWVPPLDALWRAMVSGSPAELLAHTQLALDRFATRAALWQLGGAGGRDELIVATVIALGMWLIGALTAALCRAGRSGMGVALPALLPSALIALSGGEGRFIFLFGLALALALAIALDNSRLVDRWAARGLDFNNDLFVDRWGNALAVGVGALVLAGLFATVSFTSISDYFARLISPVTEQVESASEQVIPGITFVDRYNQQYGGNEGRSTGLPNEFLLGAAPAETSTHILQLRTSDAAEVFMQTEETPRAPYLFTNAFVTYTGHGWNPSEVADRVTFEPNVRRDLDTIGVRRLLAQSVVRISEPANAPFATELLEMGAQAVLDLDANGEAIKLRLAARNYTLMSAPLALSDAELNALPAWDAFGETNGANPLPQGFESYLILPDTVTARTRELASALTNDIDSAYGKAKAIEEHLRTFPYDLAIDAPPDDVADIADYFLFDLQRGYCDYFATAFVVLARAAGLPARFVAGYAPGYWQPEDRAWLVTAANSHSWPEVYIAGAGWVAFEPTSGLSALVREGTNRNYAAALPPPVPLGESMNEASEPIVWNTQMLFWLLPLALIVWGSWALFRSWQRRREDPWRGLEKWGARRGRPRNLWETPVEYGAALGQVMVASKRQNAEVIATALRESSALAQAESTRTFAPEAERGEAELARRTHWERLRDLLPSLR